MSRGAAIKGSSSLRPQQFELLQYFVWTGPNNYHYFIVFMLITNDYYPICPPFLAVHWSRLTPSGGLGQYTMRYGLFCI